jgi:VRR-NUC domain
MSTPGPRKRPLDASEIDDHENTISMRRSSARVSLSPSIPTVPTPIKPSLRLLPRDVRTIASCGVDTTDDEVEFLYTKPPPSLPLSEMTPERGAICQSTPLDPKIDQEQPLQETDYMTSSELATDVPETLMAAQVTSTTDASTSVTNTVSKRQFSHRSSAYLQSLAEICHAILWDARWRVAAPPSQSSQRLFAWERGDDMSAVHALARRYLPLSEIQRGNDRIQETVRDERSSGGSLVEGNLGGQKQQQKMIEDDNSDGDEVKPESEADLDRCLETYSRLYFRKGPWFRLDNVFSSYYLPKPVHSANHSMSPDCDQQSSSSTTPLATTEPAPVNMPTKRAQFFVPTSQRKEFQPKEVRDNRNGNTRTGRDHIDQGIIDRQIAAAEVLLIDMKRLHRMGLVRSFRSEEECGKQVGKTESHASRILRLDEQRLLLSKLGGQHRKRKRPPPSSHAGETSSTHSASTTSPSETVGTSKNLIWKQMSQQKAIFSGFCTTAGEVDKKSGHPYLLPVIKHVNRILLEKWATAIVLKASKVEYVPSSILRSATRSVSESLEQLTSTYQLDDALCVRLRECPLRTLRRACRLYLCATSGPGDMRGDGINGWRTLPESHSIHQFSAPLRTSVIPQPGSHSWNSISYPGRDWRLRLFSYNFVNAHVPVPATEGDESKKTMELDVDALDKLSDIRVFSSLRSFKSWEHGVELRANVDYLLELNELLLYNGRKQAREMDKSLHEDGSNLDDRREISPRNVPTGTPGTKVDYLEVLTIAGRSKAVSGFLNTRKRDCMQVSGEIERDVSELLGTPIGDVPLSALVGMNRAEASLSPAQPIEKSRLQNECERILGVVAIVLFHVLETRNATASSPDVSSISSRPWLRHMCWEGCMAYVLWDVIPILERRGYYHFAIKALEVLLFGKRFPRASKGWIPKSLVDETPKSQSVAVLAQSFLSRRARGKAYERLLIDYMHVQRKNAVENETPRDSKEVTKARRGKSGLKCPPKPNSPTPNEVVVQLTRPLLKAHAPTGQITFSATRTLARRLKCPLSSSLKDLDLYETRELGGHRFSNGDVGQREQEGAKYSDWAPVTDTAVANAMVSNDNAVGGRCAYIGFEDDEVKNLYSGSLNVEELAMEYYNKGVLPATHDQSSTDKGGWVGWHDEGGKIRALFRILSSATLGMDWGGLGNYGDDYTLFLTPYQGAPLDLHVGAELVGSDPGNAPVPRRGIYNRKRTAIEEFLDNLSRLRGEELADLVYDCIKERLMYSTALHRNDPSLERDVSQVRTLSMLAAGFGGNMLAAIFRCLFFDYRHYSGGLPDLLLVRAIYSPSDDHQTSTDLVDLGDWIGESFSKEYQDAIKAEKIAQVFAGKDEEFLGCSKVGDSGGRGTNQRNKATGRNTPEPKRNGEDPSAGRGLIGMPDRLRLRHNDRNVRVECMCVEVKSQNDRLDPRQEDWLNILDRFGNARVCKFAKPKKPPKATKSNNKENGNSAGNSSEVLPRASSS